MKTGTTVLFVATIFGAALARDLPEFLHVCNRNDPNLGSCIQKSVEYLRPYLSSGQPEYNIPSLEPLLLEEVSTSGSNVKLLLKDLHIRGASNFIVPRLKANLDTLRFVIELSLPSISLDGTYDVNGKVILLTIQGTGPISGNFTNCKGLVKLQSEVTKGEDGKNYIKITDFKTKISVGKGNLRLKNLFGGDPVLGEALNTAINTNFDGFIKDLQPSIENAISTTFRKIANSILTQFTYEQLFPSS